MATLLILPAPLWIGDSDAQLVAGDGPAVLERFKGRLGYSFDATAEEAILTPEFAMPTQYTGSGLVAIIHFATKSDGNSAHTVDWDVFVEAVTPDADTLDMEAAVSGWSSANSGNSTIPGTAGNPSDISITLSNTTGVGGALAVGDLVRFGLRRDTIGTDDTTGDVIFFCMEIADDG